MKLRHTTTTTFIQAVAAAAATAAVPSSSPVFFSPPRSSCAATSWPPTTIGGPNLPQPPRPELHDILSRVDPARIEATVRKLVSFGTRHTLSEQDGNSSRGIGAARDWIAEEFRRYAGESGERLGVEVVGYEQQPDGDRVPFPVQINDVVATLHGSLGGDRVYVVSGHYDSRCTDPLDTQCDAPGANDDASGVALSLELARVMSLSSSWQPLADIAFVAVAGEEQGLYGAQHLAQTHYAGAGVNVEGMLNNDIVGSSDNGEEGGLDPFTVRLFAQGLWPLSVENETVRERRLGIGGENDTPARNLARATGMNVSVIYRLDRYLRSGDHRPFLEAGYPAVRFTEPNENFDHQHQDVRVGDDGTQYGDLPEFCDWEYIARVARINGAALWSLASAPGMPQNVGVNTTELSNDSVFYWDPPVDGEHNVGGYDVVWRNTAEPFWTHVIDVGLVNEVSLTLSKDNVVFGVRARGLDGLRGVAVLPFPGS